MRLSLLPLRPHAPASRMAQPSPPRAASWPVVSITVLLCVSALLPPIVLTAMNATLVALAVGVVLWANRKIDPQLWHLVLPFAVIVMLGLIMGVQAERYKYFKDAWYVGNPVLVVLTGYVLYRLRPDVGAGLRAVVVGGFLVALWQMRAYYSDPSLLLLPADTIRRLVGTGHYAPVAAVVILLLLAGRWRAELRLPTWLLGLMFGVIAAAVLGVFSRTALMVVLIAIAARLGAFAQREWLRLGLPFLLLVCVAFGMQIFFDVESDRALKTFVGKLARTLHELTVSDYAGLRDINLSFRGHEMARALSEFNNSSLPQMLLGRGFGATVDLGVFLPIEVNEAGGRVSARYITLLHNGYMFLLTKTGIVGLVAFLYALGFLYFVQRHRAAEPLAGAGARMARLLQAAVVTLATTTYVVGGVFNKQDMFAFMLLTGYLLAHLSHQDG